MRDRRLRELERRGEVADTGWLGRLPQREHHLHPGRIGQCLQHRHDLVRSGLRQLELDGAAHATFALGEDAGFGHVLQSMLPIDNCRWVRHCFPSTIIYWLLGGWSWTRTRS